VQETARIIGETTPRRARDKRRDEFTVARVQALGAFFAAVDQNITALAEGGAFEKDSMLQVPAPPHLVSSDEA
jgi:hypothetical protein